MFHVRSDGEHGRNESYNEIDPEVTAEDCECSWVICGIARARRVGWRRLGRDEVEVVIQPAGLPVKDWHGKDGLFAAMYLSGLYFPLVVLGLVECEGRGGLRERVFSLMMD